MSRNNFSKWEKNFFHKILFGIAIICTDYEANKNLFRITILSDLVGIESIHHDISRFNLMALQDLAWKIFNLDEIKFIFLKGCISKYKKEYRTYLSQALQVLLIA